MLNGGALVFLLEDVPIEDANLANYKQAHVLNKMFRQHLVFGSIPNGVEAELFLNPAPLAKPISKSNTTRLFTYNLLE